MRTGSNIRQRADGRFEARYTKARDERGRIIYGYCYGKTYEEAAGKREAALMAQRAVREMNLLILGAGSHGRTVRELAESLRLFPRIAFLDDNPDNPQALATCADCARFREEYPVAIPAVGDRELRLRWLRMLIQAGFVIPVLIHPTAVVSPSVEIGYGTVVDARSTIGAGVKIGAGSIVSSGATIDRGMVLPEGSLVRCGQVVMMEGLQNQPYESDKT